jgi:hypothetical protein
MRAIKTLTEYRTAAAVKKQIEINQLMRANFEVHNSNYTTAIVYPSTGYRHKFITSNLNKMAFIAHAKMKVDILKNAPDNFWSNNFEKDILLYDCTKDEKNEDFNLIINFDLKNAYPTALVKAGFLSEETAEFIEKRNKLHRLQAIGIFAGQKRIFKYEKGILSDVDLWQNPLKNVYFFAAKKTDNIIKSAAEISGDSFLFFWFDGIYIRPHRRAEKMITDFFESNNIAYKKELIRDLKITYTAGKAFISYTDIKEDRKTFAIPTRSHQVKKDNESILKFLG